MDDRILIPNKCKHCGGRGKLTLLVGGWECTCENTELFDRPKFEVYCHAREHEYRDLFFTPNEAILDWNNENLVIKLQFQVYKGVPDLKTQGDIFLYSLSTGECASDYATATIANTKKYSDKELMELFSLYVEKYEIKDMWGFISFLEARYEFFHPTYAASIDI